jgi:hypothetical protein
MDFDTIIQPIHFGCILLLPTLINQRLKIVPQEKLWLPYVVVFILTAA